MNATSGRARVLMCPPQFYGVEYVINPWMTGNVGRVDTALAQRQWDELKTALDSVADVLLVPPAADCPDMVFAANAGFLHGNTFYPSRFRHEARQKEETRWTRWFAENHFEVRTLPTELAFEGAGDCLWDWCQPRIWAGYGFRTELMAHAQLEKMTGTQVYSLHLIDSRFYHLDTCFCPLPSGEILYYPLAFDAASLRLLQSVMRPGQLIAVAEEDALNFVCNGAILGDHFVCHKISRGLRERLEDSGHTVTTCELGEFLKAGGSARCLTLPLDFPAPKSGDESQGGAEHTGNTGVATGTDAPASSHSAVLHLYGHLLDDGILNRALEAIVARGASYEVESLALGHGRMHPSRCRIRVQAPSQLALEAVQTALAPCGGGFEVTGGTSQEALLRLVEEAGVAPDDFYSTSPYATSVLVGNHWVPVTSQRMDAVILVTRVPNTNQEHSSIGTDRHFQARCVLPRDLLPGDVVVCGTRGIRTHLEPPQETRGTDAGGDMTNGHHGPFGFMSARTSSERRVETLVDNLAWEFKRLRDQDGHVVVVAGPVVIHAGGGPYLAALIREGFVGALLSGNALAVHDVEANLFGTSLGVDLQQGSGVSGGHVHHLRAINSIRRAGSIHAAVERGVLTGGIMYECVKHEVPFCLAGSIRDDGPLPDTQMDLFRAQACYARLLQGSAFNLMLGTMLHSVGAANMTPAGVRQVCVDINPAVVTKLTDRGSLGMEGIVTDVGLFLRLLHQKLGLRSEAATAPD